MIKFMYFCYCSNVVRTLFFCLFIFLLSFQVVSDTDLGWHLRVGEYIFNNRQVPNRFLFSFANSTYPYTHYSWAAELVMYLFYKPFGLWGISIFYSAILTGSVLLIAKTCLLFSKKAVILPIFILITPLAHAIAGGRTIVFGLLFFSLIYYLFEKHQKFKSKSLWLIPIVFLLWANFHASFVVGIALFIILLMLNSTTHMGSKITLKTKLALIILSILATLINPYTSSVWSQSVLITARQFSNLQSINPGWSSPFTVGTSGIIYILILLLVIILICISKKVNLQQKILICLAFILTLSTIRFLFILLIFITPAIYIIISEFIKKQKPQILNSFQVKLSVFVLFSTLILLIIKNLAEANFAYSSFSNYMSYLTLYSPNKKYFMELSPNAYTYFKDGLKNKNVLTDANWGGLFILDESQVKVFYYGAMDNLVVNGKTFSFEYLSLVSAANNWQEKLDEYKVEIVFLAPSYPLIRKLQDNPKWQKIYQDNLATILMKI